MSVVNIAESDRITKQASSFVMAPRKKRADRRTFTWRCWWNGVLRDVVIEPPAREEKNAKQGGVRGRIYERNGDSLKTIAGVVHQDADGRTYFIQNDNK